MNVGLESRLKALLPSRLRARIFGLGSTHKHIARGVFVVGFFVLVGKLAGAAKEIAVAQRYGVSETVDAYLFVFNLAQWPAVILGGMLAGVLIPLASQVERDAPHEIPRFRAELFGSSIALGLILGVIAWAALPWLVQQTWIGLVPDQTQIALEMAGYLAWLVPLGLLARLLGTWTMVAGRHLNTLLEGVPALVILAAVMVGWSSNPLVWGTLMGFALQVLLLAIALSFKGEMEYPRFTHVSAHWRAFFTGFGMVLIGQTMLSLVSLADQFFAARLGPGAISELGYASRILSLLLTFGGIAIARAILPVLSRQHLESEGSVVSIALRWAGLMGAVGLFVGFAGFWLAPYIVELLFERGRFTELDTIRVVEVLRYGMIQVPVCFSSMVLTYALLSQGRQKAVAILSILSLIVKIGLAMMLIPLWGLGGVFLATAGVYFVSSLLGGWLLWLKR